VPGGPVVALQQRPLHQRLRALHRPVHARLGQDGAEGRPHVGVELRRDERGELLRPSPPVGQRRDGRFHVGQRGECAYQDGAALAEAVQRHGRAAVQEPAQHARAVGGLDALAPGVDVHRLAREAVQVEGNPVERGRMKELQLRPHATGAFLQGRRLDAEDFLERVEGAVVVVAQAAAGHRDERSPRADPLAQGLRGLRPEVVSNEEVDPVLLQVVGGEVLLSQDVDGHLAVPQEQVQQAALLRVHVARDLPGVGRRRLGQVPHVCAEAPAQGHLGRHDMAVQQPVLNLSCGIADALDGLVDVGIGQGAALPRVADEVVVEAIEAVGQQAPGVGLDEVPVIAPVGVGDDVGAARAVVVLRQGARERSLVGCHLRPEEVG